MGSSLHFVDWTAVEAQQPGDVRNDRGRTDDFINQAVDRIGLDRIFDAPEHQFQKSSDKWRGGCPWHESTSGTSFTVDPETGLWHCAGCQKGGGAVQYLHCRRFGINATSPRGAEFTAVLKQLSELSGLPLPGVSESPEQRQHRDAIDRRRQALEQWNEQCQGYLWSDEPEATAARDYMRSRGFSRDDLKDIGCGLAVVNPQTDADPQELRKWHIGQTWWRNYITFPWCDESGQLLTMYGKVSGGTPAEGRPKTLALAGDGTKRSPMYFDRARLAGHRDIVLVEGVTDAAIAQVRGDTRVVACVAAQLSTDQVETLRRCGVTSVTVALDPDKAGISGNRSCLRQLSEAGIPCYVAPQLPNGQDPDEFIVARGVGAWREHIAQAENGFRMVARQIIEEATNGERFDDRTTSAVVRELKELLACTPAENLPGLEAHRVVWDEFREQLGCDVATAERLTEVTEAEQNRRTVSEIGQRLQAAATSGDIAQARTQLERLELVLTPPKLSPQVLTFGQLQDGFPELRPVLIDGLLRRGETMNVVAPSKLGKSWLSMMLAVAAAAGDKRWMQFDVTRSRVLHVDTELHPETLANRLRRVAGKMFIPQVNIGDTLRILPTRGTGWHVEQLDEVLNQQSADLVVVDALYRAIPPEVDENDNRAMAEVYNGLDSVARRHDVALVLIHHSTKGDQSSKSLVDIGAGAGSMARAADTHLALIEHKVPDCAVLRAVCRSFATPEPIVIQREHPLWKVNLNLDPQDILIRKPGQRRDKKALPDNPEPEPGTATQARTKYFDGGAA